MAGKKSPKPARDNMTDEERKKWRAKLACRPSVNSAAVTSEYASVFGEQDISALVEELAERTKKLESGDMQAVEAMLYGQAYALQSIFVSFARRAANQEYLKQYSTYLGLALKAQAQCRATLETLAEIKNPKPPTFVRQQNVAYQQQVNNGRETNPNNETSTHAPARAAKTLNSTNELLEQTDGQGLEQGTAGTTGATDPHLATVGSVQRS